MAYKIKTPKPKEKDTYSLDNQKTDASTIKSPQYLIEGFRWLDKTYGNAYHSVIITDLKTGAEVYRSPYEVYGYGSQWEHTAYDELQKLGKVKEVDRFNHDLNSKRFIYRLKDVQRKKDLF
jgi:hypothetical protein